MMYKEDHVLTSLVSQGHPAVFQQGRNRESLGFMLDFSLGH